MGPSLVSTIDEESNRRMSKDHHTIACIDCQYMDYFYVDGYFPNNSVAYKDPGDTLSISKGRREYCPHDLRVVYGLNEGEFYGALRRRDSWRQAHRWHR